MPNGGEESRIGQERSMFGFLKAYLQAMDNNHKIDTDKSWHCSLYAFSESLYDTHATELPLPHWGVHTEP